MDSNHDSQIQSLESYQLDDPGAVAVRISLACDANATIALASAFHRKARREIGLYVPCAGLSFLINWYGSGEVSERFKEHAWKACVGEILPWVRIPPSPPFKAGSFDSLRRAFRYQLAYFHPLIDSGRINVRLRPCAALLMCSE
jgi:hypothetical protein